MSLLQKNAWNWTNIHVDCLKCLLSFIVIPVIAAVIITALKRWVVHTDKHKIIYQKKKQKKHTDCEISANPAGYTPFTEVASLQAFNAKI